MMEHVCLHEIIFKGKDEFPLMMTSNDEGKTWEISPEYSHQIFYCPYCGVKLSPNCGVKA